MSLISIKYSQKESLYSIKRCETEN